MVIRGCPRPFFSLLSFEEPGHFAHRCIFSTVACRVANGTRVFFFEISQYERPPSHRLIIHSWSSGVKCLPGVGIITVGEGW